MLESVVSFLAAHVSEFGVLILGAFVIYDRFIANRDGLTAKIIGDYKTRNGQLEEEVARKNKAITDLETVIKGYQTELAAAQASMLAKDTHISDLKELLLDKNPDVVNLLKEIRDSFKAFGESNAEILGYQTEILEEWRERSHKIDEASSEHIGDPLRLPPSKAS